MEGDIIMNAFIGILLILAIYAFCMTLQKETVISDQHMIDDNYTKKLITINIKYKFNDSEDEFDYELKEIYQVRNGKSKKQIANYILKKNSIYLEYMTKFKTDIILKYDQNPIVESVCVVVEDL